jgi:predicted DNA binding CopG/RHH family protein
MKKATKIPEFKSLDEEFEFWSTHDSADLMEEGEEVEFDFSEARKAREKRQAQQISLRVSVPVLSGVKNRAKKLGVPYQTLMQLWLAERLEIEEAKTQAAEPKAETSEASRISVLPGGRVDSETEN